MGQLNLFSHPFVNGVPDELTAFLAGYRGGQLRVLGAFRLLDDKSYPHVYVNSTTTPYNYIVVPILDPLATEDINWLFRGIVAGEYEISKESALAYSHRRVARRGGSADREKAREFRRALEVPKLALTHYKTTYQGGHLHVELRDGAMAIEYGDPEVVETETDEV